MKKRRFFVLAFALPALAALIGLGYRLFGEYALQSYVGQLRSKGEQVSLSELAITLSPCARDSSVLLSNIVSRLGPPPANLTNLNLMRFVSLGRACLAARRPEPPWASSCQSSTCAWTSLNSALAQAAEPLAELRAAMKQPAPNGGPRTNLLLQPTISAAAVESAAVWLASAGLADLREHRTAAALADVHALASLANLHREECTLYNEMIRDAVAEAGLDLTWEALQSGEWDDDQLLALQQKWQGVDLLDGLERGFKGERLRGFETLKQWLAQKEPQPEMPSFTRWSMRTLSEILVKHVWLETVAPNDLRFGLGYWQGKLDLVRDLKANRSLRQVLAPWEKQDTDLDKRNHPPLRYLFPVSLATIPNPKRALLQTLHVETERRLALTALALQRYKRANGRPPASLDALVPDFLPRPLLDCMSGRPLGYQANSDRTFTLYSAGNDGVDNGGDSSPTLPGGKLGLWDGRDAVWPLPKP